MKFNIGRTAAGALLTAAVVGSFGCATRTDSLQPTVRSGAETAPADLQLTCASEAASQLGADSSQVLPISSAAAGAGVYRVELTVDGSQAVCMIDEEGVVQSVEAVG